VTSLAAEQPLQQASPSVVTRSVRESAWIARALWAAVAVGTIVRLRQYLHARPLWLDEAMLANNILGRTFVGLLLPLHSDQTAPVPFLWMVKASALLAGSGERVLRTPAVLSGVLLLVVVLFLARRLLAPWTAVLAVWIAAMSPMLIQYSNEVKPYGLDALWSAGLALLTLRVLESPGRRRRWVALWVVGVLASVSMSPAPFVLTGVGLTLLLSPAVRRVKQSWLWLGAAPVLWSSCFVAAYFTVYRAAGASAYMQRFWVPHFLSPTLPGLPEKIARTSSQALKLWFVSDGGWFRMPLAALLIVPMIVGAVALHRRRHPVLALFVLPVALAIVASAFRHYPVAPRLMLFSMPGALLLLAAGTDHLARWVRVPTSGARRPWFAFAAVALLLLPAVDAIRQFRTPPEQESIRGPIETFLAEHRPGATVYVYGRTVPAWLYYTTDWEHPELARVDSLAHLVSSTGGAFRHAPARGRRVVGEGDAFVFAYRDWQEMIGVPAGTGPNSAGVNQPVPDSGWAENEARRMAATGSSEVWSLFTAYVPGVPSMVDSAVVQAGGRAVRFREQSGAAVAEYRFERTKGGIER